jgi:hypothetical protein
LYYTYIKYVPHVAYKVIFQNIDASQIWHDRLGHPGVGMRRKIISNCIGHNLKEAQFPKTSDFICTTGATGKLILRALPLKIHTESLKFLERIGGICGHTTIIGIVQVFHGINRRIYSMVTRVYFIDTESCIY